MGTDLSGAVEVDPKTNSISTSKPDLSGAIEVPEKGKEVGWPSKVVRGIVDFMGGGVEDFQRADYTYANAKNLPDPKTLDPHSYHKAIEKFYEPYNKQQEDKGVLGQLQTAMLVGGPEMAFAEPLLTGGALAFQQVLYNSFDARKAVQDHFPNADPAYKDYAEILEGMATAGAIGIGSGVTEGLKAMPNLDLHDLIPEKITDIQHNLGLTKQEQNHVFMALGVKPQDIATAKSQDMSVKVPMSKVSKLTQNKPLWDKVKGVFSKETVDGKTPKVVNAALEINSQLREGPNHHAILEQAVKDGLISKKDAKSYDIEKNGKFTTNLVGRKPLTRAQASREFGIDHSEQIPEQEYKFVKNDPLNVMLGRNMKLRGRQLREDYSGLKNRQITRGNQLSDHIKRLVPDEMQRRGIFWYKAAKGNMNLLAAAMDDVRFQPYKMEIANAINMSDKQMEALDMVNQYYEESGRVSQSIGTINSIRENYQNRMTIKKFDVDKETGELSDPKKPTKKKTEINSNLNEFTSHRKQRVFKSEFEAVMKGYGFQTTDVADSLSIHNQEMAKANAAKKLYGALEKAKLGRRMLISNVPEDYEIIKGSEKETPIKDKNNKAVIGEDGNQVVNKTGFAAPKEMAKAMKALTEPNLVKRIDALRAVGQYQGVVKTVDLACSFFHHFSMAAQTMYQGGIPALMNAGKMNEIFASKAFNELESDFARHTGMTSKIEQNRDILRNILEDKEESPNPSVLGKAKNVAFDVAHRNTEFLFGKFQRFLKVTDYGHKISSWIAEHPSATDKEIKVAKTEIAKQINTVYGGLNWEAMGITQSNLSLLRLGLLAPDWTISNVQLLKQAIGEWKGGFANKGTAGGLSRVHILTALAGGMIITESLNKMLTGHYTDENPKGHELEVQIAPDVYVSFFRGGIGDITKFASMWSESGPAGASRFSQGKLAPVARVFTGLASGVQYSGGREIMGPKEGVIYGTAHYLEYILANGGPMPFSASNFGNYMKDEENKTFWGGAAVLTGLGRYSRPPSGNRKKVQRRSMGEESEMVGDRVKELYGKMTGQKDE